jgi:hypothetical protein
MTVLTMMSKERLIRYADHASSEDKMRQSVS